MTHWHISESGATVELDPALRGEAMFTVRNQSPVTDRVVLAVEPLDGAADTWLTVEDAPGPRRVGPGDSVTYVTTVAVPVEVPAGTYGLQARVYSADTDPSETSITSKRISFTKLGPGGGGRNWRKLWPLLLIPVVLLVVVGTWFGLRDSGGSDDEVSTDPPEPAGLVVEPVLGTPVAEARTPLAPDLITMSLAEANRVLSEKGLSSTQAPEMNSSLARGLVAWQDPAPDMPVAPGQRVTLVLANGRTTVPTLVGRCFTEGNSAIHEAGLSVSAIEVVIPGLTQTLDVPEEDWDTFKFGEKGIGDMFVSAVSDTGEVDVGTSLDLTLMIRFVPCPGR